jgi:hypothetical protein
MSATLVVVALGGCSTTPTDSAALAILGGAPDDADPSVVMVWMPTTPKGPAICTGTLVSPTAVLTAAHCTWDATTDTPITVEGVYVGAGVPEQVTTPTGGSQDVPPDPSMNRYGVMEQVRDPSWYSLAPFSVDHNDVALLHLGHAILKVPSQPYAKTATDVSNNVGATCQTIGFGNHSDGTAESKYAATSTFETLTQLNLVATIGSGIATNGDSGGPLICNGLIVGTSAGHDKNIKPQTVEYYSRIDQSADFITKTITSWTDSCLAQAQNEYEQCVAEATSDYLKCLCAVGRINNGMRRCGSGGPSTLLCRPPKPVQIPPL